MSGMIGDFKGVMFMYVNFVFNVFVCKEFFLIIVLDVVLLFLFFLYVFERMVDYFFFL